MTAAVIAQTAGDLVDHSVDHITKTASTPVGKSGSIRITTGNAPAGQAGDIVLSIGTGSVAGHIILSGVPASDPHIVGALYTATGALKVSAG